MSYDLIVVGTGPAGAFFLEGALRRLPASARVLVLERGPGLSAEEWRRTKGHYPVDHRATYRRSGDSRKDWFFTVGLGGSSNCWYACTPRMLPEDFKVRSLHGVSVDWPVSYEDLEPWYCDVEERMAISGRAEAFLPRSRPFPQRPHRWSSTDEALARLHPGRYTVQPAARARDAVGGRPPCCASGVCHACPVGAKWTVVGDMADVLGDSRVEVRTGVEVRRVIAAGGRAEGVAWRTSDGREGEDRGEVVALAANGIFNPAILLASGINHGPVGEGIHEQIGIRIVADLAGLRGGDGSTHITGHGYMFYEGPWRSSRGAILVENFNSAHVILRPEPGRAFERMVLKMIVEEDRLPQNRVTVDADGLPVVHFEAIGERARAAIDAREELASALLAGMPVERMVVHPPEVTEAHLQGTCPMSADPSAGVVDGGLVHHRIRNLLVLGSSAFPSGPPANPTLTLSALSLRAAALYYGDRP